MMDGQPYSIEEINDSLDIKIKKLSDYGGKSVIDYLIDVINELSRRVGYTLYDDDPDKMRFIITVTLSLISDPNSEFTSDEFEKIFIMWWDRGGRFNVLNKRPAIKSIFSREKSLNEIVSRVEYLVDYGMCQRDIQDFLCISKTTYSEIMSILNKRSGIEEYNDDEDDH